MKFCLSRASAGSHLILLITAFIVGHAVYGIHRYQNLLPVDFLRPSLWWCVYGGICAAVFYAGWIGYGLIMAHITKQRIGHILIRDAYSFLPLILSMGVWLKHLSFPAFLPVIPAVGGVIAIKVSALHAYRRLNWLSWSTRTIHTLLTLCILFYAVVFGLMTWLRLMAFRSYADFGIFVQQLWGFAHFKLLPMTTARGFIFFGDHVSPILCILAPFYWIVGWLCGGAVTLGVLQSFGFAIGALPLYWLARDRLHSPTVSLFFPIIYLLYPGVQLPNLGDFHESLLIAPLSLFAFYYLQRLEYRRMWVFVILTLMCKEDASLIIGMLGAYTWFILRNRALGVSLVGIAIVWLGVCLWGIVPFFREGQTYGYLGFFKVDASQEPGISLLISQIMEPIRTSISLNKIIYFVQLLLPLGFLSLAAPAEFLIGVPTLLALVLYTGPPFGMVASISSWHTAAVVPWVFISSIYGVERVMRGFQGLSAVVPWTSSRGIAIVTYLALCGVLSNMVYGVLPYSVNFSFNDFRITEHDRIGHDLLTQIPPDAAVSTTSQMLAHLGDREWIYHFPEPFKRVIWMSDKLVPRPPDYVLVDTLQAVVMEITATQRAGFMEEVRAFSRHPDYHTFIAQDGYVIFKRNKDILLDPKDMLLDP